mgnify:CR=1 FL=1
MVRGRTDANPQERVEGILDAALRLLATHGIAGVSMRAVAREADVGLGLVNYYYTDKHSLVCAALQRIEEEDVALLDPVPGLDPREQLVAALKRVAEPALLTQEYLALRLQLWSLATAHPDFAAINARAHERYRARLTDLVREAQPSLSRAECRARAADVDVVQNGLWLSALLGVDRAAVRRALERTESIALG